MFTTKCETCLFNVRADGVQVGCKFNRLDKLSKELVDNNYVINRFCNTYRPKHWAEDVGESDLEKLVEIAKNELIMPVNYIIDFNYNLEDLKKTIWSIENIENFHPRSKIMVINDKIEYSQEIFQIITSSKFSPKRCYVIFVFDTKNAIDQAAKDFVSGLVFHVKCGYIFDPNFYNKIHKYVNEDMKSLHLIKSDDGMVFFAKTFIALKGNMSKMTADGEIDNKNFVERVAAMSNKKIIDWKEFFKDENSNGNL